MSLVLELFRSGYFIRIFINSNHTEGDTMAGATDASVLQKCEEAYDEARGLPDNNLPPIATVLAQVATLTQANADLTTANATLTTQTGTLTQEKQDLQDGNTALQTKMGLALEAIQAEAQDAAQADAKRQEAIGHLS